MPGPVAEDSTRPESRRLLPEQVAGRIFADILSERFPVEDRLPRETDLAASLGVSRLTLREAMKHLQSRGVVSIRRGNGTFVNPRHQWAMLDPLLLEVMTAHDEAGFLYRHLTDMRRIIESGLAGLAAERRSDAQLARLAETLDEMRQATDEHDYRRYSAADLAFHDVILEAAGNPFAFSIYGQLQTLLVHVRDETSRLAIGRREGLALHGAILEAIRARDAAGARTAVETHFETTAAWVEQAICASSKMTDQAPPPRGET